MPRKVRQLKADLRRAGFIERPRRGKGSQGYWEHPDVPEARVLLSGHDGDDAQPYQERQVRAVLARPRASARTRAAAMSAHEPAPITPAELAEARRYSLLIARSEEDGAYLVTVPELPGLMTHGRTHEEAVTMGEEAVATWLAGLRAGGHPVPPPRLATAGAA
ncbi:MAG TPA: type II toxin-antitoxin system HicB family antitoxin [Thermomicrobiales bacterium]|nr:type II toxin-antitoxin system HicB family antitoxin [Thermomicrobiales bacterium]